jgi:hypothetical protein
MNIHLIAFILMLATVGHDIAIDEVGYCSAAFLTRYMGIWPKDTWKRWCCIGQITCHMQFHIRYFAAAAQPSAPNASNGPSVPMKLSRISSHGMKELKECRVAIAMKTLLDSDTGQYSITTLAGYEIGLLDRFENSNWIVDCVDKRWAGVVRFQKVMLYLLRESKRQWLALLTFIESVITEVRADIYTH